MKELTSRHDDMEKRLAIFFGLGAFLVSSLVGLIRGYTLEGFLLQGVVVLTLGILGAYAFGAWLRRALESTRPAEELPAGTERRAHDAETLEEGSLVVPGQGTDTVVAEEEGSPSGQVVNFSFPELDPKEAAVQEPAPAAQLEDEGDLPPPPVPAWLK